MESVGKGAIARAYPPRGKWNHKGEHGKLLVIAGSSQYTGSATFNCMAALRAGCDLVHLYTPSRPADVAAGYRPDIITIPFEGTRLSTWNLKIAKGLLPHYDALAIGGGLGPHPDTAKAVREILSACKIPAVVDADAIRALEGHAATVKGKPFVLTPHANEFLCLGGKEVGGNASLRASEAKRVARALGCTVLLKGAVDFISDGKTTLQNTTGSPFMTKGGGGDCLAGMCGALLARGLKPIDAACASAYINGLAGSIAARGKGEGYIASDLLDRIPEAIGR